MNVRGISEGTADGALELFGQVVRLADRGVIPRARIVEHASESQPDSLGGNAFASSESVRVTAPVGRDLTPAEIRALHELSDQALREIAAHAASIITFREGGAAQMAAAYRRIADRLEALEQR